MKETDDYNDGVNSVKTFVLAEKPSVGRELARVLGCHENKRNYFEGKRYVVTWGLGHLVTLAEPEDYNDKYRQWELDHLPILPKNMKLKVLKETSRQFKVVQQLAKRADLKELIIATDAGREGELVARWIMEMVRWNKPYKRLWISSQTDQAIKDGFAQLKPGKNYDRLYESAVCRAEADWLIGLNVTRALTCKYNIPLSAGRVQTPSLAMIVEREEEIRQFVSKPYRLVELVLDGFHATWRHHRGDPRIFKEEQAESLVRKLTEKKATITNLHTATKTESQPLPYDLTELQRDANRRYGFSAKKTSSVLQLLYERHKLVTYPRTDSRYLSSDMLSTLKARLDAINVGSYKSLAQPVKREAKLLLKRAVNDAKVTDHHAIIPTEERLNLAALSPDERRLYDLIARRFLALFYPVSRYDESKVTLEANGESFHAAGKVVRELGWKQVYDVDRMTDEQKETQLPTRLQEGQTFAIRSIRTQQQHTQPPARYTEASLLTQMEKYNLGTPATRADIIEKLINADSIQRQGAALHPTPKGEQLLELVTSELRSPELTAKWESELEQIAKGNGSMHRFLDQIRKKTAEMVQEVRNSEQKYKAFNPANHHCPDCGHMLQQINHKRGKTLRCIHEGCGYKRSLEQVTINKRCPQCRKKMLLRDGKKGKFAQCRHCNIVETLDNAQRNRKAERREMHKLKNKYSSNESFGVSLADKLKEALKQSDK